MSVEISSVVASIASFFAIQLLSADLAAAQLSGEWYCVHENNKENYRVTRGIEIVGNTVIETDGLGRRNVIKDVVISNGSISWNNGGIQQFEFHSNREILVETTNIAELSTVLEYHCTTR